MAGCAGERTGLVLRVLLHIDWTPLNRELQQELLVPVLGGHCGRTLKRSEDVRARINVLSEIPDQWENRLERWSRLNHDKKRDLNGFWAPSRNDEYLPYQTLLGVWPLEDIDERSLADLRGRIQACMQKAAREATVHKSWVNVNTAYEGSLEKFVDAVLDGRREKPSAEPGSEALSRRPAHGRAGFGLRVQLFAGSLRALIYRTASPCPLSYEALDAGRRWV